MGSRRENAEAALTAWRENYEQRDTVVRKARKAQISIHRIHDLTGISRSTIYRILDDTPSPPPAKATKRRKR